MTNAPPIIHWEHRCHFLSDECTCYTHLYVIGVQTEDGTIHFFYDNCCPEHRLLFKRAKGALGENIKILGGYTYTLRHQKGSLSPATMSSFRNSASFEGLPREFYEASERCLKTIIPDITKGQDLI